jgi:hypothetical protein
MLVRCFAVWSLVNPDNLLWSKFRRYGMSKGNCEIEVSARPLQKMTPCFPDGLHMLRPFLQIFA